ncbi:hypothetical protein AB9P05_16470 [Roseivirga sp. BDSF3-8]|uniref:hypothetical protein n=1 Tax=Roseivirga sp. BDSF3-8 TaxID=3241598 RepID=UPI00353267D4
MRNHMEVEVIFDDLDALLKKINICYYSDSGCEDLYVASEQQDTVELKELNIAFLDSLIEVR